MNELGSFIEKFIISINIKMSVAAFPFFHAFKKSEFIPALKNDCLIQILPTSYNINFTFIINFVYKSDH